MREIFSVLPEDLFAVSSPLDTVVVPRVQRVFLDGGRFPVPSLACLRNGGESTVAPAGGDQLL